MQKKEPRFKERKKTYIWRKNWAINEDSIKSIGDEGHYDSGLSFEDTLQQKKEFFLLCSPLEGRLKAGHVTDA